MQYVGADLVRRLVKKQPAAFIDVLENLILRKSWWDTVDALSVDAGTLMLRTSTSAARHHQSVDKCREYVVETCSDHPSAQIQRCDRLGSSSGLYFDKFVIVRSFFFERLAGWALREYSKTNPDRVRSFLDKHKDKLSGLTIREGSKYV